MTDFETRRWPYAKWDNSRRRRFLRRLIGILRIHASVGIGVGLVLPDYDALTDQERELIGRPYPLCSLKVVAMVFGHMDAGADALAAQYGDRFRRPSKEEHPVDFVFEAGDQDAGNLAELMRKEAKTGLVAGRIASCAFIDKRKLGALQAADLAAYETTKQLVRTIEAEQRGVRKSLTRLITRVRFESAYFNAKTFPELIEMARQRECRTERPAEG